MSRSLMGTDQKTRQSLSHLNIKKGKTSEQNMKALKSTLSIHIPLRDQKSMDMCVYTNAGRNTNWEKNVITPITVKS